MKAFASAAGWLAFAAVAHTLWLATIVSRHTVGYDHWGPAEGQVGPLALAAIAFFVAQGAAVARALARDRRGARIAACLRARLGLGGGMLVAVAMAATTAQPNRDLGAFALEVASSLLFRAIQLATLLLAIDALPAGAPWSSEPRSRPLAFGIDRYALACAAFAFVATTSLVAFAYEWHPHVPDEVAYLWQARYFATGSLRAPLPPVPEAFAGYLIDCGAHGCGSPAPPGWPAMLALGVLVHLPWLVNPALSAANVMLTFAIAAAVYDLRVARAAATLLAVSPWFLFTGMPLMTHQASLFWALVAVLAAIRLWRGGSLAWCVAAGVALGAVSLVRPLEGVIASAVCAGIAFQRAGRLLARLVPVAAMGVTAAVGGGLQLAYNALLTGNPLVFPINEYTDRVMGPGVNAMGFGPNRGVSWGGLDPFPGHGFRDVVVNSLLNATSIQQEAWGWAIGSLLPVAVWIGMRRCDRRDAHAVAAIVLVVGLHAFYWFSGGPDFGARYWFLAIVPLTLLTARALLAFDSATQGRAATVLAVVTAFTLATYLPWRGLEKYRDYRGMHPGVQRLQEAHAGEAALVLIRGRQWPDLASALPYNPVDLRAPTVVFAWDRDAGTRARLLAAYPDRTLYVVDGPSRTGSDFVQIEGPVPPGTPLATPPVDPGTGS